MRRDLNLIRQIMFKMEDHPGGFAPHDFSMEGYPREQVLYHIWLLGDSGLMKVADATHNGASGPQAIPISLTSEGHDFLDAARSDTIWTQSMDKIKSVGGTVSLMVLKVLLESMAKIQLGI